MKKLSFLLCILFIFSAFSNLQSQTAANEFVTLAWGSFNSPAYHTDYNLSRMSTAGFTHHLINGGYSLTSTQLNYSANNNLQVFVYGLQNMSTHSAIAGAFMWDEPSTKAQIDNIGNGFSLFRASYPNDVPYCNLGDGNVWSSTEWGGGTYEDKWATYVQYFIDQCDPDILSFDSYPIRKVGLTGTPYVWDRWFAWTEIMMNKSKIHNIPWWGFINSVYHLGWDNIYLPVSEAYMKFQAFTNLVYGAQGNQYHTYQIPGTSTIWIQAPLTYAGAETTYWTMVKNVNARIALHKNYFNKSKVLWVKHKNSVPMGTTAFSATGIVSSVSCLQPITISQFTNNDGLNEYVAVFNRKINGSASGTINFTESVEGSTSKTFSILPGDIKVYKVRYSTVTPTSANNYTRTSSGASSSLTGWSHTRLIDGNLTTSWSSERHYTADGYEWFAFWFPTNNVNYIKLVPRNYQGKNLCVPETVTVYYSAGGGSWVPLKTVMLPIDMTPTGYYIRIPTTNTNGILITTNKLRTDGTATGYYFQMAECYAGYKSTLPVVTSIRDAGDDIDVASEITGVEENSDVIEDFRLEQNYPNPFNPATTISYRLPATGFVTVKVFDTMGKEVETLVNESKPAGLHSVKFDGSGFASGVYLYSIKMNGITLSKKMLLMK